MHQCVPGQLWDMPEFIQFFQGAAPGVLRESPQVQAGGLGDQVRFYPALSKRPRLGSAQVSSSHAGWPKLDRPTDLLILVPHAVVNECGLDASLRCESLAHAVLALSAVGRHTGSGLIVDRN